MRKIRQAELLYYIIILISLLPDRLSSFEVVKKLSFPNFLLIFISIIFFHSYIGLTSTTQQQIKRQQFL